MNSFLKRAILALFAVLTVTGLAVAANMSFSTGAQFLPGPRLIDGSDLNVIVDRVNGNSGGTVAQNILIDTFLKPSANDGAPVGTAALSFSDLFLASGGVINWNNGNTTLTQSAGTLTNSGITVSTGGIAASAGSSVSPRVWYTCNEPAIASTSGNDSTPSVTEMYVAEIFVPANSTVTGVALFNGSATGSGNVQVSMYTAAGAPITAAQSASTAISGTDAYQLVPFAAPWAAVGPATYYVATEYNNTGTRFNTHVVGTCGAGKITGTTYGTFAAMTPPTTFTTALGPIASLY